MPSSSAPLLDTLFASPEGYLREIDRARREALFLRMDRAAYVRSSFLDDRTQAVEDRAVPVPLGDLLEHHAAHRPAPRRLALLFHTAFCGSTLLSRCLDWPGVALAYKEPYLLHQLSYSLRYAPADRKPYEARLLDLAAALLERTYETAEVPVVKPSDSCINLARPLLTTHAGSAGVLLYAPLESFLLAILKAPERRRYARGMAERARLDLRDREPPVDLSPDDLTDAQAAGYAWMGLMDAYLDLLADQALSLRSLPSTTWYDRPEETLRAAADFLDLNLSPAAYRTALDEILPRDAKTPQRPFDRDAYAVITERLAWMFAGEIYEGVEWVERVTRDRPIPRRLPRPLLPDREDPKSIEWVRRL